MCIVSLLCIDHSLNPIKSILLCIVSLLCIGHSLNPVKSILLCIVSLLCIGHSLHPVKSILLCIVFLLYIDHSFNPIKSILLCIVSLLCIGHSFNPVKSKHMGRHAAASHLGLYCLSMSYEKDAGLIWVNVKRKLLSFVNDNYSSMTCNMVLVRKQMSRLVGKHTKWFSNRSDTNRLVQAQKIARSLKFHI